MTLGLFESIVLILAEWFAAHGDSVYSRQHGGVLVTFSKATRETIDTAEAYTYMPAPQYEVV